MVLGRGNKFMNTQAAIEAAKIAAETAARNAWITTIVTVIALIITSGISIWSVMRNSKITKELGEKNLESLEQKRYIDAISVERIKWINTMRDNFSDFLKNVNLQMGDIVKLANEEQNVDEDKMVERLRVMMYTGNHIFLLLNPTEPICKEIIKLQIQIVTALEGYSDIEFDYDKLSELTEDLVFLYQVVLKAEWKRVKEENKIGEEIDDNAMYDIYISVAEKLDKELYNKYLTQLEEKAPI